MSENPGSANTSFVNVNPNETSLVSINSESSISDEERASIEHVLMHGAPPEAGTPSDQRLEVVEQFNGFAEPTSQNPSWINRIKTASASLMGSMKPTSSENPNNYDEKTIKKKNWKSKLWTTWNNIKYSSKWMPDRTDEYSSDNTIVFLGKFYFPTKNDMPGIGFEDFCSDYYSRIWITYRTEFSALLETEVTTDCGWGCMLRTTQMMTAQTIILNRFGRNWRYTKRKISVVQSGEEEFDRQKVQELTILKLFEDKKTSPLGIHRLISIASREKGEKAVGCWYSPSESAHLMKRALSESTSPLLGDTSMLISMDGKVHIRDVELETKHWSKVLILVVIVRLGAAELNPIYVPHIRKFFSLDSCLGVIGGRPDHSSWFIGYYDDQIIYLDPHVAHEYRPIEVGLQMSSTTIDGNKKPRKSVERSYHCKLLSKMHFLDMDPSCGICFRFESREQFDRDMMDLNMHQFIDIDKGEDEGMKRVNDPMFSVVYGERRQLNEFYDEEAVDEAEKEQANQQGFEML